VRKSDWNWIHDWTLVNYGLLAKEGERWSLLCMGVNTMVKWLWLSCDIRQLQQLTLDEVDLDSKLSGEEEILDPLTWDVRKTFYLA